MRLVAATMVVLLLLAPEASAQVAAGGPARMAPTQAEIAAQASFDTSYLLALYMTQLAEAGTPPSQSDIDEATRQYLTNGAAVTSVPGSGPAADYFRNGAAVTGVPTRGAGAAYFQNGAEVMSYAAPRLAPPPETAAPASSSAVEWNEADAGVPDTTESAGETAPRATSAVPIPQVQTETMASGLTCSPLEIEAAMAIASQFAAPAEPSAASACLPSTASTCAPMPAEREPPAVAELAPHCPPQASLLSRIVPVLGGALFGGLAVVLWSRPRPPRVGRSVPAARSRRR